MENRISCWIGLCAAILLLFSTVSCDSSSSEDIPDEVLEVAGGVFGLIGEVLGDPDNLDPGLSVTHTGSSLLIEIDAYSPDEGIWVSGEINLIEVSNDPYKISITGNATMTGDIAATIGLQAVITWPAGSGPDDSVPSSITGTFVYNGKSYNLADIVKASGMLDDEDAVYPEDTLNAEAVLKIAEEVFVLIQMVLEDTTSLPEGAAAQTRGTGIMLILTDYSPEDNIFASGTMNFAVIDEDMYSVVITGDINITGAIEAGVQMDITLSWNTGEAPDYDPPSIIEGNLIINDIEHDLEDILDAL